MLRALFSLDWASWSAPNIVLVETTPIDGTFRVLESWKGDLSAGSQVVIPDLIPKVNALPISAYPKWWAPDRSGIAEQIPRQPAGSRLVLFLRRNKLDSGAAHRSEWVGWVTHTDEDSMKISAVWIDAGATYFFTQRFTTSDPLALTVLGEYDREEKRFEPYSEESLKQYVENVLRVQSEMTAILAEKDGRARVLRLKPYVTSKILPARQQAMEELGKSGPSAVETIGEMLDDPVFAEQAPELVDAMVKAGGKEVGGELNRRLEQDVAFWMRTGPSLSPGWWNEDPMPNSPLRNRYGRTYRLVYGLEQTGYPGALNTAIRLRDLWRTLPPLDQNGEQTQMLEECGKLIALLERE